METLTYKDYIKFLAKVDSTPVSIQRHDEEAKTFVDCDFEDKPEIKNDIMYVYYTTKYGRFMKCLEINLDKNTCMCYNIHGIHENGTVLRCSQESFTKEFIKWLQEYRFESYKSFRTSLINRDLERLQARIKEREAEKVKIESCETLEDLGLTETV